MRGGEALTVGDVADGGNSARFKQTVGANVGVIGRRGGLSFMWFLLLWASLRLTDQTKREGWLKMIWCIKWRETDRKHQCLKRR